MLQWLPEDVSTFGHEIDSLFYLIYYITGVAFILVTVLMVVFVVMYRERNDGRRATYSHGNTTLEIIWTVIPAAIFIALSFMSVNTWAKIKRHAPESDFEIAVAAKQFNWEVSYPAPTANSAPMTTLNLTTTSMCRSTKWCACSFRRKT